MSETQFELSRHAIQCTEIKYIPRILKGAITKYNEECIIIPTHVSQKVLVNGKE